MVRDKKINDKETLFEVVDHIIDKNHEKYSEFGRWEHPHLKTYLIESNIIGNNIIERFSNIDGMRMFETESEDFYRLGTKGEINSAFLDVSHGRIWKLHTFISSNDSDTLINKLVDSVPRLDYCWFSNQLLNTIQKEYKFRGIGVQYEDFFNETFDEDTHEILRNSLSFKMWNRGDFSKPEKELYALVNKHFSRNSIRVQELEEGHSNFLNELYYHGKITTTYAKNSNDIINKFPNSLIKLYMSKLSLIEENRGVFGDPIEILFNEKIPIQKMVDYFKNGKLPFKLWLTTIKNRENFVNLYGVDLHTGDPIGLDIGEDFIWLNIPKSTCGNAGMRIPTLLSFSFPSSTQILLGGNELAI